MNIAVVLAGGVGKRLGLSVPKQFMKVSGRMVIEYSVEAFEKNPDIDEIAIVSHADYVGEFQEMVRRNAWKKVRRILLGGKERYDSSLSAIRAYEDEHDVRLIFHDGVRPLVSQRIISDVVHALDTYDAEPLTIPTLPEWNITGSLLPGFDAPVYRFIPGITRSEGLFVCVLRKFGGTEVRRYGGARYDYRQMKGLSILVPPLHHTPVPPTIDLPYSDALKYLRGEALVLPPGTPQGIVTVTYKGVPLGPVKNIGSRANNLYPKPWRIKTTHLPTEPVVIICKP